MSRSKTDEAAEAADDATAAEAEAAPEEALPAARPKPEPAEPTIVAEEPAAPAEPDPPGPGQDEVVEDPPISQETDTPPEIPKGHVAVVYHGLADLIEYGTYKFRPGQPVHVPSDAVEELLTWPNERFEQVPEPEADEE